MKENRIYVIGHKNPDTDSICSAIAYAHLRKTVTGNDYVPARAGEINPETAFVLDRFQTEIPIFMDDVRTQIKDVNISPTYNGTPDMSIREIWHQLEKNQVSTLTIVDEKEHLLGLITKGDIAKTYMGLYNNLVLSENKTPYKKILETLNGEMLVGDPDGIVEKGKILIAAANPDLMEEYIEDGDMVMLGDRYESQLCAIEMNAGCLIVCMNTKPNDSIIKLAEEHGCTIILTPYDTFIAARLINQSMQIRHFMVTNAKTFKRDDFIEDVRSVMAKNRHRAFPVVDHEGKVLGMFTRHNMIDLDKKKIALVDHNEVGQAVDGIYDCEIQEIVDHHKLGNVQSIRPVYFRCQPVGCTATIIYQMYKENKIEIPMDIAGLMCAAIVSDTLMYRSPTCTMLDRMAAETEGAERFDADRLEQLELAAGLHDIGKMIVPLSVMNKSTRLDEGLERVLCRLERISLLCERDMLKGQLSAAAYEQKREEIASAREVIRRADGAGYLDDGLLDRVEWVAGLCYVCADGERVDFLTPDEAALLRVRKGTLSAQEREIMESHARMTKEILDQVHFARKYADTPLFAAQHHELLDGSGYPEHLPAEQIPLETRILTAVDIYDALTCTDRPYKKPMPRERALAILQEMVESGKLDGYVVKALSLALESLGEQDIEQFLQQPEQL